MADRKTAEDGRSYVIDFSDPQEVEAWVAQVDAYLDDSDTLALAEEISRQFRQPHVETALPRFLGNRLQTLL